MNYHNYDDWQTVLMNPWHGNNKNFLFRKYHVRTKCNIIDYREEGREGGRGKERGRKEATADQNQTKERGKGEREGLGEIREGVGWGGGGKDDYNIP